MNKECKKYICKHSFYLGDDNVCKELLAVSQFLDFSATRIRFPLETVIDVSVISINQVNKLSELL